MNVLSVRGLLMRWQFWTLEAQFVFLLVATAIEIRRLRVPQSTIAVGCGLAACAWLLTATVPPRTNRIFYDEQIYQGIGRNLSDLHRAQMCNDGIVEYGRLDCFLDEYNKEPYGYPYLLSVIYRVAGVGDAAAFRLNNVVAGLAVFVTTVLAELLFANSFIAILSGLVVMLLPMQLQWSNTAAAEPVAAMMCAAAVMAAVHFTRVRTTSALVWTIATAAFAVTTRPECVLILPVIALAVLLLSPEQLWTRRLWIGALGGLAVSAMSVLHLLTVRNEGWGTTSPQLAWRYAAANFSHNVLFYFWDERFSAICGAAAVVALAGRERLRERALLVAYFLAFWLIFVFFYAGSYNYGADVRYSLMSYAPVAILAATGLWRVGDFLRWVTRAAWTDRRVCASIAALLAAQFLWYLPLVRQTGEEAWAARADVDYAREFVRRLPPNSIVLTHNPSMFHVWGVNAAQLSTAQDPRGVTRLFGRFAGGVYLHWNYWCNVADPVQVAFCHTALDGFPHDLVESRRERDYEFAFYRLRRDAQPATQK